MTAVMNTMIEAAKEFWMRMMQYLDARAESHVADWGSKLQYKRRYTNPEDAIAARRSLQTIK